MLRKGDTEAERMETRYFRVDELIISDLILSESTFQNCGLKGLRQSLKNFTTKVKYPMQPFL